MARDMTSKTGEDVCGFKMVSIDCVIALMLLEERGLWANQKKRRKKVGDNIPGARSGHVGS